MNQHNSIMDQHFLSQQYESFNQINKDNIYNDVNKIIELYKSHNELKKIKQHQNLLLQKLMYSLLTKANTKKYKQSQSIIKYWTKKDNIISYFYQIKIFAIIIIVLFISSIQKSNHSIQNKAFLKSKLNIQLRIFHLQRQEQSQHQHFYSLTKNVQINQNNQKSLLYEDINSLDLIKIQQLTHLQLAIKFLLKECNNLVEIFQSKDIEIQYNDLKYQLEQMLISIHKKSLKLINQLQSNLNAQQLQNCLDELNSINVDITQNEQNILDNMQIKPFKYIMRKYEDKLSGYLKIIKSNEVNQQKQFIDDRLKQLTKIKTTLINYFNNQNKQNSLFQSQQLSSRRNYKNNNVYISSENKEMFQIQYYDLIYSQQLKMNKHILLKSPNFQN
ncbi:unnamed protein product [Paramecium pentaurelia]|uniref:Transmembrane protein n=1 Tax=Paramecium pentaurelia TaxID=43138 RepID=A0A8S1SP43_9CILI|nr:unnamed protein product [Paramecium pentaurelia]